MSERELNHKQYEMALDAVRVALEGAGIQGETRLAHRYRWVLKACEGRSVALEADGLGGFYLHIIDRPTGFAVHPHGYNLVIRQIPLIVFAICGATIDQTTEGSPFFCSLAARAMGDDQS